MANTERCLAVADMAEKYPLAHDQYLTFTDFACTPAQALVSLQENQYGCGSTACLVGWTIAMYSTDQSMLYGHRYVSEAAEILGLSCEQADTIYGTMDSGKAIELLREYAWEGKENA